MRKYFSRYTSRAYLWSQYRIREGLFKKYIHAFNEAQKQGKCFLPCIIAIETINRCNSTCEFCPVNRNTDPRPFGKMSTELFRKIIGELAELEYSGYINLYGNNEPFMDSRIDMIINNYTENYGLHDNVRKVFELARSNPKYWDKDITIQIRYIREILTNRANTAPNMDRHGIQAFAGSAGQKPLWI